MVQRDNTYRIHVLLLVVGAALILFGIIFNERSFSNILTTIGGIFFGLSVSWLTEEYYKKADERYSSIDLFKKAVDLLESSVSGKEERQNEKDIIKFRRSPMHLYYSTKSEDGRLYWNYAVIDFTITNFTSLGELTAEADFCNFSGNKKLSYITHLSRLHINDNILLKIRRKDSQEPVVYSVFDSFVTESKDVLLGFSYHDDWSDKWRLSPSILSFRPIFQGQKAGVCSRKIALQLQSMWKKGFLNDPNRTIFEEYS